MSNSNVMKAGTTNTKQGQIATMTAEMQKEASYFSQFYSWLFSDKPSLRDIRAANYMMSRSG